MKKDARVYLAHILECAERIERYVSSGEEAPGMRAGAWRSGARRERCLRKADEHGPSEDRGSDSGISGRT